MAEAMLMGKPAEATGYSGNTEFMNEENNLLVVQAMNGRSHLRRMVRAAHASPIARTW